LLICIFDLTGRFNTASSPVGVHEEVGGLPWAQLVKGVGVPVAIL
jgi:hypothetical protein